MRVNLKNEFRGPDGVLYKPEDNPHEFPDDMVIPSTAEKLNAKEAAAIAKAEKADEKAAEA